ncbi:MAG TPA: 4a-hydroxytetrahydrobiopterin dehydratase [Brumimicrobium sp.]|nr:4a-hydroxytetrahydrobiopterin dehydratase [Brumimicrobium sp.]
MNWSIENNKMERSFRFNDFKEAIDFINKVAVLAEKHNHHPTIFLHSYKIVDISLTTADQGNIITDKDYELAKFIDESLVQY